MKKKQLNNDKKRNKSLLSLNEDEIDLHDFTVEQALHYFISFYNKQFERKNQETKIKMTKIKIIHGYGSSGFGGEIREQLRKYLENHSDYLKFIYGEKFSLNPGITIVYPHKPLPKKIDIKQYKNNSDNSSYKKEFIGFEDEDKNLNINIQKESSDDLIVPNISPEEILEFCKIAKSQDKIYNKFKDIGDIEVKRIMKSLIKKGKLKIIKGGKINKYKSEKLL